MGVPCDNYFIDIGIPEDYNKFIDDYKLILFQKKCREFSGTGNFVGELFFDSLFTLLD